jgi:single-stranded DNA-specific DHH superfamily exonuclease
MKQKRLKQLDPIRKDLIKFAEQTAERMGESAVVISIFTNNYKEGIDSLLQFSIALMLDKPLFFIAPEGTKIPEKVRKVADGIEFYKKDDMTSAQEATTRLIRRAQERGFVA